MPGGSAGHDRAAAAVDRNTAVLGIPAAAPGAVPDAVAAALGRLRLNGAVFLRAEYRENWAYESLSGPATAAVLHPGADRVILFHLVAAGACWVAVGGGERHWAGAGDVIVLPYGDQHRMGGTAEADVVPIAQFMQPPPWSVMPVLRHGAGGAQTDVVCGYLHSEDPLFDPGLRVFPPVFVVRPPAGPAAEFVRANIQYALAQTAAAAADPRAIPPRLPEMLLIEVLRLHLSSAPAMDHGLLAALRDPVLAPALAQLHQSPERKWTVADLAQAAATSRSVLDERFRLVLGRSPIRYLTEWRMHAAQNLLSSTDLSVAAIARRVGYDSEEAFSRAFKRTQQVAPSVWRSTHPLG